MSSSYRPTSRSTERDDLNSSVLKNKKLLTDAIKQKKHELTQEFKESYRERIIAVSEETDTIIKPKEHKLRHALDGLLVENKTRNGRLNELKLRLAIMKRDDISGAEIPEKPTEENLESAIEVESEEKQKENETKANNRLKDGKELIEKYLAVRQTMEKVNMRRTEEGEIQKILDAKITELIRSQKVLTERIGKKGTFYNMMKKRFVNLGKTEFAAKNKLTRTTNKLLSMKKEIEKQTLHENDFFNQKQNALKRSKSVVEEHKDIIAKNLIYLEETKLKKEEIDEKLEEVEYEERQIISKRQASEYILLYIDLLESLESGYLNESSSIQDPENIHIIRVKEKAKSMISVTKEPSQKQRGISRSQTIDLEKKALNDTNKDRDIVITRIAQFYDQHPNGINTLVTTLMKIYSDMQMKEQSLSTQHQDLNAERVKRQTLIKNLEDKLQVFHEGFILLEDKLDVTEEASPEHIRETERRVAGKLSKYDLKTVQLGEYLVNLCAEGIRDALCKLNSASCSLAVKCGKRIPTEIANKVKEIEAFLLEPKPDFSVSEAQSMKNKSTTKNSSRGGEGSSANNMSLIQPQICSLAIPNLQEGELKIQQNAGQVDEKKDVSRTEEVNKVNQRQSEEFAKLEPLLKTCFGSAPNEIVYKWNEKIFEEKWMLDYLNKSDVQKILARYVYYYGNELTEGEMKNIIKDLKNEARLIQRRKTSEIFDWTEALFLIFMKHYKSRKAYLSKHFQTEIKSEILDNLNDVMAVSEHVEKAQEIRYQNMFLEPTEDLDIRKRTEEKPNSDPDVELILLRNKNAQEVKIVKTTREAVSELHSRYQKERKVASSHGYRSNSMPKLRVKLSKKKLSMEAIQNDETIEGTHQVKETIGVSEDKKHTAESVPNFAKKKSASCVLRDSQVHAKVKEDHMEEERENGKKILMRKSSLASSSVVKDNKKEYFVPSSFYRAQAKSKDIEEFMKRIVKDEEILRKITLLEKRQTEFDKKSKDCDKRKDYVPNFSLLQKFDLSKERRGDQTMEEWWRRQEAGTLDYSERGKSITSILLHSERKEDKSARHANQQLDSTRSIIYSQNRKSSSRGAVRPKVFPEEAMSQTARTKGYVVKVPRKRENSLDDVEKKLFLNVVSQSQSIIQSSSYNLK